MAKQSPADRFSIDNQLIVHLKDLNSAQRDRQLACLELASQDTPDRRHAVAELEKEIEGHELAIDRLNAAKLAQASQSVDEDNAAKLKRLEELAELRRVAVDRAKQVTVELVDFLAGIGPLWTSAHNSLSEVTSLAREIVRLAGGAEAVKRFNNNFDSAGHGALATAVASALAATGLGTSGPSLAPMVAISPPLRAYTATDLSKSLDGRFAWQDESIESALNPQPATDTEEI
jgi:hypothetical protein